MEMENSGVVVLSLSWLNSPAAHGMVFIYIYNSGEGGDGEEKKYIYIY